MVGHSRQRGFSLVEALVAGAILSGAVLTVTAISTNALSAARLNRQYEVAAAVADRQLRIIDYVGIDGFLQTGRFSGDVSEFEPGYHWEVATEYQDIDSLYLVTVTVSWVDRGRPYKFMVETMLDGQSTYTQTGTTDTTSTGSQTTTGSR